jgi:D-3-phosphoglycerate dehydrogenase
MAKQKKLRVLIAELTADVASEKLGEKGIQVDVKYGLSRKDLLEIIPKYHGIIIRSETLIDQEFLKKSEKLVIVGRAGSGFDNIDLEEAAKAGVIVANTPESNIVSAAEHTMGLLIASARNVAWADSYIKSGKWGRKQFKGTELYQKTLGIIGLGRIGSLVARRAKAFDMDLIAYDPYIKPERFKEFKTEQITDFDEILKRSDFITIHTPRTKETIDMVNDDNLELLKEGVRLVNVARGGLFNEDTLVKGLKEGKIASVAIDVWMNEPQADHELYKFNTAVGTPHLGASTFEAQDRVGLEVANRVIAALEEKPVPNMLNGSKDFKKKEIRF